MDFCKSRSIYQYLSLFGVLSAIMFSLHLIIGNATYPGFNPIINLISQLTANGAPSVVPARTFATLNSIFAIIFSIVLLKYFNKKTNAIFYTGIVFFTIMSFASLFVFLIFPFDQNFNVLNFQNIMHNVSNTITISASAMAMLFLGIGILISGKYGWLAVVSFLSLFVLILGGILFIAGPKHLMGLFERVLTFPIHIFNFIFSLWMFIKKDDGLFNEKKA